ncbi:MAG TPA: porin [Casimicrobiaceae bacterium]
MKKKLVAVAVAGVLGAPLVAQAQTANVTLYGRLNVNYELVDGKQADGSNPNVSRLSSNSSRLGVRGSESLGGGLSAIFQIESSISGDGSGGTLAGRETFVGFQGSWGKFTIGRFLLPLDDMHPIFGNVPTYTTSILSTAAVWANGFAAKQDGGFDDRANNSVRYDSPSFNGLTFSGQVAMRDSSGTTGSAGGDHAQELRHAYIWGANAIYNNGPIQVGVGYENNQKVRGPGLSDYDFTITGGYNFGVVRVAAVYDRLKYDTPTGDLKRDFWGISATAPIGPGTLYAFYGQANDGKGSAADGERVAGLTHGSDTGAQQWEISYTYPFSKRTSVYAGYVKIDNDSRAAYNFNINSYEFNTTCRTDSVCPNGSNGKPGGFVLGMIHLF